MHAPTTIRTAGLLLRPMTEADCDDPRVRSWHTDPVGYTLMNEEPDDEATVGERLHRWQSAWNRNGIGYWIVERADEPGMPIGIGGLNQLPYEDRTYLNLYYRLVPEAQGHGYARIIASAAVAWATEWRPDLRVIARPGHANVPSERTALRSGMIALGAWRAPRDPVDQPDSSLFESPVIAMGLGDQREQVVDLWNRVNAAGGAVGWVGEAPRGEVEAALEKHLTTAGSTLVRIHAPTRETFDDPTKFGDLIGFGVVAQKTWPTERHRATLYRVMTEPTLQGRGLGRVLMAGLHRVARDGGVEISELSYRGGTGLQGFYERLGYVECGRITNGLRFAHGYADHVMMCRSL